MLLRTGRSERAKDIGAIDVEMRRRNRGLECTIYSIWGEPLGFGIWGKAAANYLIPDGINLHRQKFGPVPAPLYTLQLILL